LSAARGASGARAGKVAVCVYCASSDGVAPSNLALAEEVGLAIAARGWTLVSGGGRRSMMGAVARGARAGGARTVGVIPRSMVEREWADHESDELLVTDTMRDRKSMMDAHADAFLTLPGGIGTLEELFEVWSSGVLDLHRKPVVLLDPDGHYNRVADLDARAGGPRFRPAGRAGPGGGRRRGGRRPGRLCRLAPPAPRAAPAAPRSTPAAPVGPGVSRSGT